MLVAAGAARADSGLGPADAEKTLGSLRYLCVVQSLCPLSAANYDTLKHAIAGQRDNQFLLGLNLINGEGVPTDRTATRGRWFFTVSVPGLAVSGNSPVPKCATG